MLVQGVFRAQLSPILFFIYSNNLCNDSFEGTLTAFANDTVLTYVANNDMILYAKSKSDNKLFRYWMNAHFFMLSDKSKYIVFRLKA